MMIVTALFSMFMSNTATTAMMLAVLAPVVAHIEASDRGRIAMVLAVPVAANIGGMAAHRHAAQWRGDAGPHRFGESLKQAKLAAGTIDSVKVYVPSFAQWMLFAVPLVVVLLGNRLGGIIEIVQASRGSAQSEV